MLNSRGYVKNILAKNKRQKSKIYQSLLDSTETPRGSIQDINWDKFNNKELGSLSRMKLKYLPELAEAAHMAIVRKRLTVWPTLKKLKTR